jgi:hypothetical protein
MKWANCRQMEEKDYDVFRERKQDKRERERECVWFFKVNFIFWFFFSFNFFLNKIFQNIKEK